MDCPTLYRDHSLRAIWDINVNISIRSTPNCVWSIILAIIWKLVGHHELMASRSSNLQKVSNSIAALDYIWYSDQYSVRNIWSCFVVSSRISLFVYFQPYVAPDDALASVKILTRNSDFNLVSKVWSTFLYIQEYWLGARMRAFSENGVPAEVGETRSRFPTSD